jgi:hypothetical protein
MRSTIWTWPPAPALRHPTRSNTSRRIPATFVYAGIDLARTGLLSGTRGQQIAGRFSMIRTGPFGHGEEWSALVAALETSLRLHEHSPAHSPGSPTTCTAAPPA